MEFIQLKQHTAFLPSLTPTHTLIRNYVVGDIVFLIFSFHFVVVYLICFYMWLRVLTSRKVTIYSDRDNIIIIIIGFLV